MQPFLSLLSWSCKARPPWDALKSLLIEIVNDTDRGKKIGTLRGTGNWNYGGRLDSTFLVLCSFAFRVFPVSHKGLYIMIFSTICVLFLRWVSLCSPDLQSCCPSLLSAGNTGVNQHMWVVHTFLTSPIINPYSIQTHLLTPPVNLKSYKWTTAKNWKLSKSKTWVVYVV